MLLLGGTRQGGGMGPVGIRHFETVLAATVEEAVAQDREQPGRQAGAGDELVPVLPGLEQGVLHHVVGVGPVMGEGQGVAAQPRHRAEKFAPERRRHFLGGCKCLRQAREHLAEARAGIERNDLGIILPQQPTEMRRYHGDGSLRLGNLRARLVVCLHGKRPVNHLQIGLDRSSLRASPVG